MMPVYIAKPLTEERLTQEIMIEALTREDVAVSVKTSRQTCLLLTQLNRNIKHFEAELLSDAHHTGYPAIEMATFLVRDVEEILRNKEAASYKKKHLTNERTVAAMKQAGITVEVDLMESLLAAYAVGGGELLAEEWLPHLKENGLTIDGIEVVAKCY